MSTQYRGINRSVYPCAARYIRLWKLVQSNPPETFIKYDDYFRVTTVREARQLFRDLLNKRINERGGLDEPRGRKDNPDYRGGCFRDQYLINNPRAAIHPGQLCTPELRRRFAHRITPYTDY